MSSPDVDRLALVQELLELSRPLDNMKVQLAKIEWDYDGEGVELTAGHFSNLLLRYIQGEISDDQVETWANLVEGREDVQFATEDEAKLEEVLFELANPAITQTLDHLRAKTLLEIILGPSNDRTRI
jgi:hypothetical protein